MTKIERDARVSAEILASRANAGNPNTHCPLCVRTPSNPSRRLVDGAITEGCIDACHTGQLVSTSESNHWHLRDWAIDYRRDELQQIRARARYHQQREGARL